MDALTIVIPHRRHRPLLERCLHACAGWRVLVVDDTDDGLDLDVPRVRLGGGSGFANAANAGLAAVSTPLALLLNDDAAPLDDCVARLLHAAATAPRRLIGPVLTGPHGIEGAGFTVRSWGRVVQRRTPPAHPGPVDALSGACLLMPASLRFDPGFRHGYEDVALCRDHGGGWIVPHARCWHEGGATVPRTSPAAQRAAVAGQLRLFPPGWREGVILSLAAAQAVRESGLHAEGRAHARARIYAAFDAWRAHRAAPLQTP